MILNRIVLCCEQKQHFFILFLLISLCCSIVVSQVQSNIQSSEQVSVTFSMRQFSCQRLAIVICLYFIDWTSASIAAIHNLHKIYPLCDIDGNGFIYTEVLDFPNRKRVLTSNACPNHFNKCQDEECSGSSATRARENSVTFDVPLYPVMAEMQTDTTCVNGSVALALNGVSIESMSCKERKCVTPGFNAESRQSIGDKSCDIVGEGDGTWICGDAVELDATKIDKCGGHVDDRGLYHYHIPPVCLIQQLTALQEIQRGLVEGSTSASEGEGSASEEETITDLVVRSDILHSVQVGWALDGFPIYGPIGPNGVQMQPCSSLSASDSDSVDYCLDECNGLYGAFEGVDDYMYRYYISGELGSGECSDEVENGGQCSRVTDKCCINKVPSSIYQPYTIGCFKGCQYGDISCAVSAKPSVTDTYYPQLSMHPKEVFGGLEASDVSSIETPISDDNDNSQSSDESEETSDNDYSVVNDIIIDDLVYAGYGRTAVRLPNRKLGILSKIRGDDADADADAVVNPPTVIEELSQSDEDAFITGLTLGYRGENEASSQLLFTTQRGLWVMQEDGQLGMKFVAGYKTVLVKGYNFGSSLKDIKLLTVKGQTCSYLEVIDSMNVFCILSNMADDETIEDNDVILNTVAGNNVGIHSQPLTVALGASKRAVVAEIVKTTYSMLPYAVAYPFMVPVIASEVPATYVYWSDLASHRIYRSTVTGSNLEVVMEEVYNVYSLLVMNIALSQGQEQSNEGLDQFVFYTDSNRGILGRISVSSGSRLESGPYVGNQHSVENMGSENGHTNVILLKGLSEPRGISSQIERDYFYIATYEGDAFEAPLSHFTSTAVTPATPFDMASTSTTPSWLKRLIRSKTSSRFDGIGTLPLASPAAMSSNTVKSWNEQYIFIPDTSSNSLIIVNDDSFALSILNLNEGFGSSGIIWPRSIASRRPYTSGDDTPTAAANNTAVVFIGELLGKIWRVELDFTSLTGRKIALSGLKRPQLIADYSKYSASIRLRNLVNEKKFIDDRNNLVFPEIIN